MKKREKRQETFLDARVNVDGRWQDGLIRNVSRRGVMVQCEIPPPRGSYVEIRRGRYAIIGHVRWNGEHAFGTQAQDPIDIEVLSDDELNKSPAFVERRSECRCEKSPRKANILDEQHKGRVLQWSVIAGFGVVLSLALAQVVQQALTEPLDAIKLALSGSGGR